MTTAASNDSRGPVSPGIDPDPGARTDAGLTRATPRDGDHLRPTARARRGRPGHDLESVLAGAVEVFNEKGYDGTSMEDLSRRLGIAKSAIYHHIDSKEELLRMAVDRALDDLFNVAAAVGSSGTPAIDRLERVVEGSVEVLIHRLPYVTLLLRVRGNTETERRALARRRHFDQFVTDLARQAADDGDLRTDIDPAVIAHLLYGMVNSIVEWYRAGSPRADRQLPHHVAALAFDGLRVAR